MRILATAILFMISTWASAIDLRDYFPDNAVNTYNISGGQTSSRYTFQRSLPGAPTGMDGLYYGYLSLPGKTGVPYMWQKEYWTGTPAKWCTQTYAVLFMGTDQSVTEVGDWTVSTIACTPNTAFGYKNHSTTVNTGLVWSPAGGVPSTAAIMEGDAWRQNYSGAAYAYSGSQVYSKSGLIEQLATFTPDYGRDATGVWGAGKSKTYTDVIHIVMYHGTKTTGANPVRCIGPLSAYGVYYQSYKDFDSYAIELWLAKGVGIIQENTPYIENAAYWGIPNCTGDIFSGSPGSWKTYIDQM